MRVLLTTDTIGGVWAFTKELSEQLLACGQEVSLLSFGRQPSSSEEAWCSRLLAQYPAKFAHKNSSVPLEWMANNDATHPEGSRVLMDFARDVQPDLLHSNQYCFGDLPLGVPKVITAHSDVLSWAVACRPRGLQPSKWLTRYCELVEAGLNKADALVAPTHWMLDALSNHFRIPSHAEVIPNGRSVAHHNAPSVRMLQSVTAGRLWDEAKGIEILMSIDSPMPIIVAGEANFELTALEPRGSNLRFVESLVEDDLFLLFRESSVYLVTSTYEPFGLAPLEAALCGCAIVARDLPSLREVWADSAVYFHDAGDLERILKKLAHDETVLKQAQFAAMQRAMVFSAKRMALRYSALYKDLLGSDFSGTVKRLTRLESATDAA